MRTTATNKAHILDAAGVCPSCGRQADPQGCRPGRLPGSWFCVTSGLSGGEYVSTGSALREPSPERRAADAAVAKAVEVFEAADARWQDAAAARHGHELRVTSGPMVVARDALSFRPPPGAAGELQRLRDIEQEAWDRRQTAGRAVVTARQTAAATP